MPEERQRKLELPLSADLERAVADWLRLPASRARPCGKDARRLRARRAPVPLPPRPASSATRPASPTCSGSSPRPSAPSSPRAAALAPSAARLRARCRRCASCSAGSTRRSRSTNRAVLQLAMPKVPHSVPKPLTVAKAAGVVEAGAGAELDWTLARDAAVLLLLYGCGPAHRRGAGDQAEGRARSADRDVLRITGKGGKERLVPVLPVVRAGGCALPRALPLSARAGRSAVPRRQGRPAVAAHHPARHGAHARQRSTCLRRRPRTRCATRSPRTCCRPAATCGRSRNCSVTPRCRRPRPTPRSTAIGCWPFMTQPTRRS